VDDGYKAEGQEPDHDLGVALEGGREGGRAGGRECVDELQGREGGRERGREGEREGGKAYLGNLPIDGFPRPTGGE
jgi:hypothetical protein